MNWREKLEAAEFEKYIKLNGAEWPQAENGILIASFTGWNDAGESATKAVGFLSQQIEATEFADIDPEEFYAFTDTRPRVKLTNGTQRELRWPSNAFAISPDQNRPIVTLVGVEPNLKWRTFAEIIFEVIKRCKISEVVLLGALVAPVPHTRPVPLTGYTTAPLRQEQLQLSGVHSSHYEGPTGILGVLNNFCQREQISCVSLWAAAPSYLAANPNWKVTAALLEASNQILNLGLDLSAVQSRGFQFEKEVSEAVGRDSDVQSFVGNLENRYDNHEDDDDDEDDNDWLRSEEESELPSADVLIRELEQQLGLRRDDDK